jgi:hypothetical protein
MRCGRLTPVGLGPRLGDAGAILGRAQPCRAQKLDLSFSLGQGRELFFVRCGQCPVEKTGLPNTQMVRNLG